MTRATRIARARSVRAHLAQFTGYQRRPMRERIWREWNRDPDYAAFSRLLMARHELNELISDLRAEGHGQ